MRNSTIALDVLRLDVENWRSFVAGVKGGDFDLG
jgi:hypothetical protein